MSVVRTISVLVFTLLVPLLHGGMREIDFRNFDFSWRPPPLGTPTSWTWLTDATKSTIRLIDGRHDFPDAGSPARTYRGGYLLIRGVAYGDLNGDGSDEAAVDLVYSPGGTANWHYLYVFTMKDSVPVLWKRLRSGSRATGGLIKTTIQNNTLVLDFADGRRAVGDCCSEGFIRVTFRWRNGRFIEHGPRTLGDLNLR